MDIEFKLQIKFVGFSFKYIFDDTMSLRINRFVQENHLFV